MKDILVKSLNQYSEIILVGSGKGVASINTINDINWKRKSLKFYKLQENVNSLEEMVEQVWLLEENK